MNERREELPIDAIDRFWQLQPKEQIAILKELFSRETLESFYYFQVQETAQDIPFKRTYEQITEKGRREADEGNIDYGMIFLYVRRYPELLEKNRDKLATLLEAEDRAG